MSKIIDMIKIDIPRIIKAKMLDRAVVAKALFPDAKYPMQALTRIEKGEAELSLSQAVTFSTLTNLPIGYLATDTCHINTSDSSLIVFEIGEFTAVLDLAGNETTLTQRGAGTFKTATMHTPNKKVSVYLSELHDFIINEFTN